MELPGTIQTFEKFERHKMFKEAREEMRRPEREKSPDEQHADPTGIPKGTRSVIELPSSVNV